MKKLFYVAVAVVAMSSASTMFTSCWDSNKGGDQGTVDEIIGDTLLNDSLGAPAAEGEAADAAPAEGEAGKADAAASEGADAASAEGADAAAPAPADKAPAPADKAPAK